jgi:hypothetical protein
MAYIDTILQAMRYGQEYSPAELGSLTHINADEIRKALKLLAQGGVIECTHHDRFIRNRKYTTKQRGLAFG